MDRSQPHQVNKGYLAELGEDECWARLGETGVGRVAMCTAEGPVILPVNYLVDAKSIVVRTAPYTQLAGHVEDSGLPGRRFRA